MNNFKSKLSRLAVFSLLASSLTLVTSVPAQAAAVADSLNLVSTGSDFVEMVNRNDAGGQDFAIANTGANTTIVISEADALVAADAYNLVVTESSTAATAGDNTKNLSLTAKNSAATAGVA